MNETKHKWVKHHLGWGPHWVTCERCGMSRMTGHQPGWPLYYVFFNKSGDEVPADWYQTPPCEDLGLNHPKDT